jgi:hypothetical protein
MSSKVFKKGKRKVPVSQVVKPAVRVAVSRRPQVSPRMGYWTEDGVPTASSLDGLTMEQVRGLAEDGHPGALRFYPELRQTAS